MAVVAVILAAISLLWSILAVVLVLVLPSKQAASYPGVVRRLSKLEDHVANELARLAGAQSQLYRYVEAVDDAKQCGPEVLGARVRAGQAQFGQLGDH